jgi:glc operon protein GlcG
MFQRESIGIKDAEKARDAIIAALNATDNPIALVIADDRGAPVLLYREDGAPARMLRRARAKAYTSANLGVNTVDFRDNEIKAKNRTLNDWGDPMITSLQGGIAIINKGNVVGGISMSGNTTIRDEALAQIGLDAMGLK